MPDRCASRNPLRVTNRHVERGSRISGNAKKKKTCWSVTPSDKPCSINRPQPINAAPLLGQVRGTGGAALAVLAPAQLNQHRGGVRKPWAAEPQKSVGGFATTGKESIVTASLLSCRVQHTPREAEAGGTQCGKEEYGSKNDTVTPCFAPHHALRCDDTQAAGEVEQPSSAETPIIWLKRPGVWLWDKATPVPTAYSHCAYPLRQMAPFPPKVPRLLTTTHYQKESHWAFFRQSLPRRLFAHENGIFHLARDSYTLGIYVEKQGHRNQSVS